MRNHSTDFFLSYVVAAVVSILVFLFYFDDFFSYKISKNPGCSRSPMALALTQPVRGFTVRINTAHHTLSTPPT